MRIIEGTPEEIREFMINSPQAKAEPIMKDSSDNEDTIQSKKSKLAVLKNKFIRLKK